jgi:hypothetical protein
LFLEMWRLGISCWFKCSLIPLKAFSLS